MRMLNDRKCLMAGDFNLDDAKRFSLNYNKKHLFQCPPVTFLLGSPGAKYGIKLTKNGRK